MYNKRGKDDCLNLAEFTVLAAGALAAPFSGTADRFLGISDHFLGMSGLFLAADWKLDAATAAKVFKKYDKDKDNELNVEELKVVIEKTKS